MENLNQQYLKQLQDLVEGNEHFGKDVIEESHKIFNAKLYFKKILSFGGELIKIETIKRGERCDLHFSTRQDLEKKANVFIEQARSNKDLRQQLLNEFSAGDIQPLKKYSDSKIPFHEFDKMSVEERCSSCGGKGYTVHTSTSPETYKATPGVFGSVTITKTGGGTSTTCLTCDKCNGTGYWMHYFQVQAIAYQRFWIRVECDEYALPLQKYLAKCCSTRFIAERTPLEFIKKEINDKEASFHYEANTPLMEFDFHVQTKRYLPLTHKALTFSNPPFAFQRPPIFDRFFTDELELLLKINADGKITKREALTFFKKFQGQPVLDQAMKNIAEIKTENSGDLSIGVLNACQNYMSNDRAKEFANLIALTLDRLAPGHSKNFWNIGSIISAIILFYTAFLIGETANHFDPNLVNSFTLFFMSLCTWLFGVVVSVVIDIIPLFLILFCILFVLSFGTSFYIRSQMPKEYRQKFTGIKSLFITFSKFCLWGVAAGIVLGGIWGNFF